MHSRMSRWVKQLSCEKRGQLHTPVPAANRFHATPSPMMTPVDYHICRHHCTHSHATEGCGAELEGLEAELEGLGAELEMW